MSFEELLREADEKNSYLVVKPIQVGTRMEAYAHVEGEDSETLDFAAFENTLVELTRGAGGSPMNDVPLEHREAVDKAFEVLAEAGLTAQDVAWAYEEGM
ncbi:hypothetical protein [Oceanidesulfovibrio marinus]|uniref:Uncharacterized protein n=1 Tax=Oceanidesulfovibrio marinus TaxID=370038 RepID=A0A6P1ZK07_9BACT|nr:hypothetical protein [Oceanidesulfovibrio marinus]TVM35650.1 hypothetical protein DQK91_03000 [Oceanidesulfovibrio marinus]